MALRIIITGGAGFIGSAMIRKLIAEANVEVINVDKLTYAGNLESLADSSFSPRYRLERIDIRNGRDLRRVFHQYAPDAVVHLAAESHVDRSIDASGVFIDTNLIGTYQLLEAARDYWTKLPIQHRNSFRFHHVSTDEVFGSLGQTGTFTETTPYQPNSPYAASKAGADHLVRAWHATYDLPTLVTNCSNNYGPYQFPEKLIPLMILAAVAGRPLPVYGDGQNVRDWLYVEDHCKALWRVLQAGKVGETYNIGGSSQKTNLDVVTMICALLDELHPRNDGRSYREQISFVADRPGHDRRYAIDSNKIERELGWKPTETFESGLTKTVEWYLANSLWCERVTDGSYRGERLGLVQ